MSTVMWAMNWFFLGMAIGCGGLMWLWRKTMDPSWVHARKAASYAVAGWVLSLLGGITALIARSVG